MDAPAAARRSRAGLLAHVAPAAVGWGYILWIVLDGVCRWHFTRLLERLLPLQLVVAALAFFGGVWAFWMPPLASVPTLSRSLRIGVSVASLLAAMLLVGFRVIAERTVH